LSQVVLERTTRPPGENMFKHVFSCLLNRITRKLLWNNKKRWYTDGVLKIKISLLCKVRLHEKPMIIVNVNYLHKWEQTESYFKKTLCEITKNDDTKTVFSKLKYHCSAKLDSRKPMIIRICELLWHKWEQTELYYKKKTCEKSKNDDTEPLFSN